jgi:hypothetical protein
MPTESLTPGFDSGGKWWWWGVDVGMKMVILVGGGGRDNGAIMEERVVGRGCGMLMEEVVV